MRVQLIAPRRIVPYHEEMLPEHTQKLSRSMERRGWKGRPLVAVKLPTGELKAVTGSHRLPAANLADLDRIPVVVIPKNIASKLFERFDESQWYEQAYGRVPPTHEIVWHLYRIPGGEEFAALVEEDVPPSERE